MNLANRAPVHGSYAVTHYADVLHLDGATAVARYEHDYYAGQPALTVNAYGHGRVYYLAARAEHRFLSDFYTALRRQLRLSGAVSAACVNGAVELLAFGLRVLRQSEEPAPLAAPAVNA